MLHLQGVKADLNNSRESEAISIQPEETNMVSFKLAYLLLLAPFAAAKHQSIRIRGNNSRNKKLKTEADHGFDADDVEFWTRTLQMMSLPTTDRPTNRVTSRPTSR